MALAATYTSENCPGIPKGAVVRVHTDMLAADQQAAWLHARRVHSNIYWQNKLKQEENTNDGKRQSLQQAGD